MGRFFLILLLMILADGAWWALADRFARGTQDPKRWRTIAAVVAGVPAFGLLLLLTARILHVRVMVMPELAVIFVFLWHFILLPITLAAVGIPWLLGRGYRAVRRPPVPVDQSRRALLSQSIIVLPSLAAVTLTGQSRWTEDALRLRTFDLPIPGLPRGLDGMTIAQVTDPHLGSFIRDAKVKQIIEMTNALDADLVLQTGDLINQSLADLPDGIELSRALRGRYGVYHCQGNHDVIDDRDTFEADTLRAGLNMLLDESRVIRVRGQKVRLMAPRWTSYRDDDIFASVRRLVPTSPDDAFDLMMVHHPHGFDAAAAAGVPLTLSGHTHGGQIALTQNIGVGPLMYRYWSGVYRNGPSTCVVSNGTGNWFPLRINVPCEILKITLHCV